MGCVAHPSLHLPRQNFRFNTSVWPCTSGVPVQPLPRPTVSSERLKTCRSGLIFALLFAVLFLSADVSKTSLFPRTPWRHLQCKIEMKSALIDDSDGYTNWQSNHRWQFLCIWLYKRAWWVFWAFQGRFHPPCVTWAYVRRVQISIKHKKSKGSDCTMPTCMRKWRLLWFLGI